MSSKPKTIADISADAARMYSALTEVVGILDGGGDPLPPEARLKALKTARRALATEPRVCDIVEQREAIKAIDGIVTTDLYRSLLNEEGKKMIGSLDQMYEDILDIAFGSGGGMEDQVAAMKEVVMCKIKRNVDLAVSAVIRATAHSVIQNLYIREERLAKMEVS